MNKMKIITPLLFISLAVATGCYTASVSAGIDALKTINQINNNANAVGIKTAAPAKTAVSNAGTKTYMTVSPLLIVAKPEFYLGKNVKFKAKFDKFSTLGLDYKPAFRSSEKFITLLIQRPDVTGHDIPLSELKIFIDRTSAEKHIDLNSGDEIELSGTIFSKALGDAWMNVDNFTVLKTVQKPNN